MTKTYIDYEFFKQTQKEAEGWKPQPIHYAMRFMLRLVFATILVWAFLCSMVLVAPVHADSVENGKWLNYQGMAITGENITTLIYKDANGNLEIFNWYDEAKNYKQYVNTIVYHDLSVDKIAVYQPTEDGKQWKCVFSDWD